MADRDERVQVTIDSEARRRVLMSVLRRDSVESDEAKELLTILENLDVAKETPTLIFPYGRHELGEKLGIAIAWASQQEGASGEALVHAGEVLVARLSERGDT